MKAWIIAFRLRTLPLSLSSIGISAAIANHLGVFRLDVFLLSCLTTILLQVLSNLANDYGDSQNGADSEDRIGPDRMVQSGAITPKAMKSAMIICGGLAFVSGITLLFVSFGIQNWPLILGFLVLGLGAIWAAVRYTAGKNPYGYKGRGDIYVFLFFGLVGVFGSYFLYDQSVSILLVPASLFIGGASVGVLNLNNMRDIDSDQKAGKITIPVRLGYSKAKVYHSVLILTASLGISVLYFFMVEEILQLTLIIPLVLLGIHLRKVLKTTEPVRLDPFLKHLALTAFFTVVMLNLFY